MNALNPAPYLFWSVVSGPIVIQAWRQNPIYAVAFLLGFYLTLIGGFALLIVIYGAARRLGAGISRWLSIISILLLLAFGLYQLIVGLFGGPGGAG